jgi:hypothetical protein
MKMYEPLKRRFKWENNNCLSENGVKIKVYEHGYAETDYLPAPFPNAETLKSFIRSNKL